MAVKATSKLESLDARMLNKPEVALKILDPEPFIMYMQHIPLAMMEEPPCNAHLTVTSAAGLPSTFSLVRAEIVRNSFLGVVLQYSYTRIMVGVCLQIRPKFQVEKLYLKPELSRASGRKSAKNPAALRNRTLRRHAYVHPSRDWHGDPQISIPTTSDRSIAIRDLGLSSN